MKLLLTAALAIGIITPAAAQSYEPSIGSGNIVPNYAWDSPAYTGYARFDNGYGAYGYGAYGYVAPDQRRRPDRYYYGRRVVY